MGRKLVAETDKERAGKKKDSFLVPVRGQMVELYLILMLGIYPLFLVKGYEDLVYRKWTMLLYASTVFVLVSLVFGAMIYRKRDQKRNQELNQRWYQKWDRKGKEPSGSGLILTDWFVLAYLICAVISYLGAVDRDAAFWGVDTWYTGFVTQLLFVGVYFGVSRGYVKWKYLKAMGAAVCVIVSGIVILQRFGIDVGGLYRGYGEDVRLNFVTTLGQVTWTSGYITILLIAGMGIYYMTVERRKRFFWGSCMAVGFAAELVLNCDSGIIALFCAVLLLIWLAVGNRERTLRLTEILLIGLGAAAVTGIAERLLAERMIPIDRIYLMAAQSLLVYLLLAAAALFRFLVGTDRIRITGKRGMIRLGRGIWLAAVCLGIVGLAVLFILHGKGYFAGSPTENYFRFTVWWGNSRGFIWRVGAAVFGDFNGWRKIFGCGPDCFTPYAYGLMGDAINEFWHNQIVPNVHNEWFNAVINYGIAGGAAYLGIFVSAAYGMMKAGAGSLRKKWASAPEPENRAAVFGIGLAAAGYIAHNVLCYQQIIATPVMFILLGLGAALMRRENG